MKSALVVLFISACVCSPTSKERCEPPAFVFYPRQAWGASPAVNPRPLNVPVQYVVVHHTAVPAACYDADTCKTDMSSMQSYHKSLGWGDIGYHFCIGSEGGAYEGRGWLTKGIHAGRANGVSVGICLIGDWRVETPPQVQLDTLKALIASGVNEGAIRADYRLVGHGQIMQTECPGNALQQVIAKWDHFHPGPFP